MGLSSGCVYDVWVVFHVDAFSTKPPDTKAKSHRYLHSLLCHNHHHETHPQICVFFLKYTRSKGKDFKLGFRMYFQYFFPFVLAATLFLYLFLYLLPALQQ